MKQLDQALTVSHVRAKCLVVFMFEKEKSKIKFMTCTNKERTDKDRKHKERTAKETEKERNEKRRNKITTIMNEEKE